MKRDSMLFPLIVLCLAVGIVISRYVVVSYGMTICITIASALALLSYAMKRRGALPLASLCIFFCLLGLLRSQYSALTLIPSYIIDCSQKLSLLLPNALKHAPMSERTCGLLEAMLLGIRTNMDSSMRDLFRQAGAAHVLALSGLHLGILSGVFIFWLQRVLTSGWRYVVGIVGIIMMWSYALLTGFPVSLCRAALMMSLLVVGQMRLVGNNTWHTLGFAAFLLLMLNPNTLFDIGFQMSFAAVTGILLFYEPLTQIWMPSNTALRWLLNISIVSLSAQLGVFPISLYWFHQFTIVSFITSPVIILFTTLILYLAVILFAILPFGKGALVAVCIEWFVISECWLMQKSLLLPFSRVVDVYLSIGEVVLMYCALLCMLPSLHALRRQPVELPYQRLAMFFRTWPYLAAVIVLIMTITII